jgi:hypothetical protein
MQDPIKRDTVPAQPKRDAGTWFALAGMVGIALVAVLALVVSSQDPTDGDQLALTDQPSAGMTAECNQYAASQTRESGEIAGAPTVSDDDPNLAGIDDENRYSNAARAAYRDCMLGIRQDS